MRPQTRKRTAAVGIVLIALNLAVLVLSVMLGERSVPPLEVLRSLTGFGDPEYRFTIFELRLPRVLTGFLAGCGLALAGAVLQVVTRNPLASPGVIGLNAGAAAAVVTALVLVPSVPLRAMPWVAFGGALLAVGLVYGLSVRGRGGDPTTRILLIGVGISAIAGALITYLLTAGQIFRVSQASIWMAGSLYGRTWEHFWPLLPWLLLLFALLLSKSVALDAFLLDTESTAGLGVRLEPMRIAFLLISTGLAGSAVSMVGTIGFVGLMAPHMARSLVGVRSFVRLPAAALLGGLIVMSADLIGRQLFAPHEIPAGLITALVGAPYMLYLLVGRRSL
ncbi:MULTISPECIES: FecCD family ABC transporter permease [Saccharibacillus]|uniref:FecCD family ABC transporter permease n=1 Tax=Saccharibacillus TaxID=456492 RepID=UPI0012395C51|nr:iron ABC transporter permease [Saccharibacillus sp. WB 17]MWJ33654.1 iron chelate uptake ABC transporter family permease subunit [Saccharibacillus sp. WB 17]